MELLEALYKSRLLYRDLRLFGDSTHFMFILQTTVDETRSGTPGLCTPHLCQVNKGRGATEGRAAVGSGALFSRLEIKLTFQPPENSKALRLRQYQALMWQGLVPLITVGTWMINPRQEKSVHIAGPPPLFSTVVHPVPLLMTMHFQGREDTTEEWSTAQSGKRILSVCDAPWQESGMAETEKLCASDFMRA
ncbi:hypothetical protein CB1_000931075 [Camelus ferus]|nr:hypothetical protein CB1_000931075 [Camelus ferus]